MDCNKDEAIRCKGIAEKKLTQEDIAGAKKFALKAQSLFPEVDGLSQFLEVINLYVASRKKINGEADLYGIFGVDPSVDDVTLRKKYRKMALILHPDKNKSVGADGAFFILSQAWDVLSDKDKRLAYNQKLNLRAPHPPCPTDKNGFRNFTSSSSSQNARNMETAAKPQHIPTRSRTSATATSSHCNPPLWPRNPKAATGAQHVPSPKKRQKTATSSRSAATPPRPRNPRTATTAQHIPSHQKTSKTATNSMFVRTPSQPRNRTTAQHTPASNPQPIPCPTPSGPGTFWTSCNRCRMQYEYPKIYLNQNLLCPYCREVFLATQKPAPPSESIHSSPGCCAFHHQKPGSSSVSGVSGSATSSDTRATQTAQRVQSGVESLKRVREEAVAVAGSKEALQKNNIAPDTTDAPSASENPVKKIHVDGQKWNDAKEGNRLTAHNMAAHRTSLEI
ncbi:Chaperone DnaJ-domain superfamily protein [Forsythia ovata]|uniref:Chaperone DnaJ-domain superfamily protein n=1 Tax=Forsythia ovata TaxID=205694 RepID=A0ABD1R2G0_9LAMI